ncbi:MAG: serine hydrolase [Brevundimonas sp.]|uniref:serine hydrolase n=1 Tax=Brevundimonas sp. TaxID=1871086 RepID=UPI0027275F5A|nr:serine hydrolase [Brevundimonas sp.]MDO9609212.1 serine hydrolase [Brevundimonas sp.]
MFKPLNRPGAPLALAGLLALVALAGPVQAQDAARMDRLVQASADADAFSGSVLVARDGQVVLDRGYGLANREWLIPNESDTKFRLGSLTKQFTAVAIMILNERGLVDLDAPVKTWVQDAPPAWDQVTVRRLLAHTAGVPNFTSFDDFQASKTLPVTLDGLIVRFRDHPLDFQPGEGRKYSNSGYVLLTAVIEKASGQSYADFLDENLFTPLGMSESGYDSNAVILPRRASGYAPSAKGVVNADYWDMSIPQGAGGLYSTTHDLLKWEQGLFGGRLLSPASLALLTTPVRDQYAFGVFAAKAQGNTTIAHSGGLDGFNTYMAHDPDRRMTVIVLGNLNGPAPDALGAALLALSREGSGQSNPVITVAPEVLQTYVGVYELTPTSSITVSATNDTLTGQLTGETVSTLSPTSADVFRQNDGGEVTFIRSASGAVTGLMIHQDGHDKIALKQ